MAEYDSIAVTGLSCRLPGNCDTLENFWESICAGESAWSEIPKERFNNDAFWSSNKRRATSAAKGAHFMQEDLSKFDAGFFGLPKYDVDAMDPQQRIMMEVAYEALERAGIPLHQLAGTRTGVFMGISSTDYRDMICRDLDNSPQYTFTGTCPASVANRLSWLWDLRGPSFPVNTACSSSLVALNLACQSLRTGESDIVIVGASSVLLYPEMFIFLSNHGFLSPDGKCKSFDASADGYGRGEGFGCIILKRTNDAIAAGDPIRAVIRGTGSNQDGRTKGLTMPSAEAQGALIDEVYKKAGLDLGTTTYVEAHGTGTKIGDLEEMEALAASIAGSHSAENKLIVGSVKSNIGHLEAAAGIAGIIKAVLMLETGLIPPNIHFTEPNPNILWDKWNVTVPTELTPWPTDGLRRISVNSFGYGGSNGHVVLDDAYHYLAARKLAINGQASNGINGVNGHLSNGVNGVNGHLSNGVNGVNGHVSNGVNGVNGHVLNGVNGVNGHVLNGVNGTNGVAAITNAHATSLNRPQPRLFVWSAQDKDGLKRIEQPLAKYIHAKTAGYQSPSPYENKRTEEFMAELAYTLGERRSRLQWKTYAIASSPEELTASLTASNDERHTPVTKSSRNPRLGFVFTGQGAQWAGMGVELMVYKVFKDSLEAADRYLQQDCGCTWSVIEELQKNKKTSPINQALYSHGLTCVLQIALVDLLRSWDILPSAVVGHSGGEIAASYASGGLTKEDAWKVAYYRGFVASKMKLKAPKIDGAMLAVGLSSQVAEEWIAKVEDGKVVVACINSPTSTTISGDSTGIDQLLGMLKAADIFAKKLFVDTAYHSPHMAIGAEEYCECISGINPIEDPVNRCAMYSTVTGDVIEPSKLGVDHWIASITGPVLFSKGVYDLVRPFRGDKRQEENAVDILLEVGPHSVLQGPSTQSLKAHGISVPYYSVLTRNVSAVDTAMNMAGALFTQGCQVNIREVNADGHMFFDSPLVDLPTYSWNHSQRFWHDSRVDNEFLSRNAPKPGILGAPWPSVAEGERLWKGFLRLSEAPWIADHKIQGSVLYPGAGYIAMALEAAVQTTDDPTRKIAAFTLRDIQFTAAGIISDDADLECIVQLRPHVVGTRDSASTWTQFTVTTSSDGSTLTQNCRGLILIEYQSADGSDVSRERSLEQQALKAQYDEAQQTCLNRLDPDSFYADMRSWGLDYGPVFANICEARNREGQSVGAVRLPDVSMPGVTGRPYIIHPGTLDAVFHLAFAAVKGGRNDPTTAMVPKSIDAVTISANVPFEAGTILPGFSNADRHGLNDLNADIVMLDGSTQLPAIVIEGFLCAEIAGASASVITKSLTGKLTWKPAISLLAPEDLSSILSRLPNGEAKLTEYLRLLYHANPALSVLEVAADPDTLLFQQDILARLAKTWNVNTAIPNKSLVQEGSKQEESLLKVLDFRNNLPEDMPEEQHDILVVSDAAQLWYAPSSAETIGRMCKVLKQDGTLCFLATDSMLSSIQSAMNASSMETTIYHGVDTSLIVAKKLNVPEPNGTTDGLTNGHTNKFTSGHTNGVTSEAEITIILATNPTETALAVAAKLVSGLQKHHYEAHMFSWGADLSALAGKSCISLLEFENSLLRDLRAEDFEPFKKLILETKSLFWVTALADPSSAMIDGLVRVVRNETPGLDVRVLHVDEPSSLVAPAERLADLLAKTFLLKGEDKEFQVKDNVVHICRAEEDTILNEEINSLLPGSTKAIAEIPLREIQYPVKLCVRSPGMLSSVCLEPDESAEAGLEPGFVEIETKATSLNFREIMVAMGQMADTALGLDAAGIVRRVGSSVTKFKVGDKVIMMGFGAHRTYHRAPASFCTRVPENMSFELAASIPVVHATAYNALVRVARVQKGQSILIHAAAGGVGQVACQIAQHFGLEVFATVSSEAKKNLIREQYGVREDHIFNSRDISFVKGIKRMTNGRGVDVVLNSLAGEFLRQTWHCIAPFGHFVEIGIKDILNNTGLDMRPFMQDATFSFFNLRHVEESRPDLMAEILAGAFDFIHRGITRPVEPVITFPVSDVEGALRLMQTGKHIGKIALTWGEDHVVPVIQRGVRAPKLSADGVYLLVGGLGGLGRSLVNKLVSLGARKLCFLSRSGAKSSNALALIQKLEQQQIQVKILQCDVGDEVAVASAVRTCTQEQGKIRGVFQCAMVLRDGLFTNMDHQAWVESTRPKVQGSWNLHTYLPDDLDFFIILSSFTGVFGSRGQSNYSSAGAYEDALAYHRRALGRHSTTIDLGLMRDIGVLAETGMTDAFRDWEQPYGIREGEFLALIERVIDRDTAGTEEAQVVTGLATGGSASLAGIDPPYYLEDSRFSILARTGLRDSASAAANGDAVPAHVLISKATSMQEAAASVQEAFVKQVAKMLQTDPSEVDTSRFLHSYGFDSLVAIEIVKWVMKETKSIITVFDVLAGVPITTLCHRIAAKSSALPTEMAVSV